MVVLFAVSVQSINILVTLSSCQAADLSETLPEDITFGEKKTKNPPQTVVRLETASSVALLLLSSSEICGPASQGYITGSRPGTGCQVCDAQRGQKKKKMRRRRRAEGCGNHLEPTLWNLRLLNDRRQGLPSRTGEDVSGSAFCQRSGTVTSRDGCSRPPKAASCE